MVRISKAAQAANDLIIAAIPAHLVHTVTPLRDGLRYGFFVYRQNPGRPGTGRNMRRVSSVTVTRDDRGTYTVVSRYYTPAIGSRVVRARNHIALDDLRHAFRQVCGA